MIDLPAVRSFDAVLCDLDNVVRFFDHTEVHRREAAAGREVGDLRAALAGAAGGA
ncbi:hypothetical protein [Kitasatospora sp. LaBMicrA B282]|uniref:hypothetical protein n=1 Tax=Kitasatospora sp. LaBMicrA B282 TaxID=3420949 RepID=UPI003D0FC7CF